MKYIFFTALMLLSFSTYGKSKFQLGDLQYIPKKYKFDGSSELRFGVNKGNIANAYGRSYFEEEYYYYEQSFGVGITDYLNFQIKAKGYLHNNMELGERDFKRKGMSEPEIKIKYRINENLKRGISDIFIIHSPKIEDGEAPGEKNDGTNFRGGAFTGIGFDYGRKFHQHSWLFNVTGFYFYESDEIIDVWQDKYLEKSSAHPRIYLSYDWLQMLSDDVGLNLGINTLYTFKHDKNSDYKLKERQANVLTELKIEGYGNFNPAFNMYGGLKALFESNYDHFTAYNDYSRYELDPSIVLYLGAKYRFN